MADDDFDPAMMYGKRWRRGEDDDETVSVRPSFTPTPDISAGITGTRKSQVITIGGQKATVPTMEYVTKLETRIEQQRGKINDLISMINDQARAVKRLEKALAETERRVKNPYGD
jgi:hypothetical protein